MPMRVISYADPSRIYQVLDENGLTLVPHICATPSLMRGVRCLRDGLEKGAPRVPVMTLKEVLRRLVSPWLDNRTLLSLYASLTGVIAEAATVCANEDKAHYAAFRRNQRDVVAAIRLLVECGLEPEDLKPSTRDESIFRSLWHALDGSFSVQGFRSRLEDLAQPGALLAALDSTVEKIVEDGGLQCAEYKRGSIILQGFYFITPIQRWFMDLCDMAGIELVFLNHYDPRFPNVFQTWRGFFCRENGLPALDEWVASAAGGPQELSWQQRLFADCFEGRRAQPDSAQTPIIYQFEDTEAFVQRYLAEQESSPEDCPVYVGSDVESISCLLADYYPGTVDSDGLVTQPDRHFLSYPVGQLLLNLHRMWDEQTKCLTIESRAMFECFASGWLQVGALNGKSYLKQLEDMLPFFSDCRTLLEWRQRAHMLRDIRDGVVARFSPAAEPTGNSRYHQYLSNPLERFAHFRVESRDVQSIVTLMEHLFSMAEQLFAYDEKIGIGDHLKHINEMLLAGADHRYLVDEELALLDGLSERLKSRAGDDEKFRSEDLADAVALYLGGKLRDDRDEEGSEWLVQPLSVLDGLALVNSRRQIHLCMCSDIGLPRVKAPIPWPLSTRMLEYLRGRSTVRQLLIRDQEALHADRYLMHCALSGPNEVEMSWITNWQGQRFGPSPYLSLIQPYCRNLHTYHPIPALSMAPLPDCRAESAGSRPEAPESIPMDALAEYAICPRRFYYSFVAQSSPSYRSDFHHQFLFSALASSLAEASGVTKRRVAANLAPLFPQWTPVRLRDLADRLPSVPSGFDRYDGADYPSGRQRLVILNPRDKGMQRGTEVFTDYDLADRVRRTIAADIETSDCMPEACPGEVCKYCPHDSVCTAIRFAVDDGQEDSR